MVLTKRNVEAAMEITNILAEKDCTVADLPDIFSYVQMKIGRNTTVQKINCPAAYAEELEMCEK